MVTGQLIYAFVFAYAKSRFSHDAAPFHSASYHAYRIILALEFLLSERFCPVLGYSCKQWNSGTVEYWSLLFSVTLNFNRNSGGLLDLFVILWNTDLMN